MASAGTQQTSGIGSFERRVLDASRSLTVVVDLDGRVSFASASIRDLLGLDPLTLQEASVFDWLHPDDVERAFTSIAYADEVRGIRYFPMVFRVRHSNGAYVEFDVLSSNQLDDPMIRGIVLDMRAADERTQYIEPIRALASGATYDQVLSLIASAVGRGGHLRRPAFVVSDRDPATGVFTKVVSALTETTLHDCVAPLFDGTHDHLWPDLAQDRRTSLSLDQLPSDLASFLRAAGFAGLRIGAIGTGTSVSGMLVAVEPELTWIGGIWPPGTEDHWVQLLDVATIAFDRLRAHSQLEHAASHDSLTGLANRAKFFDSLTKMMSRTNVAVLYMDLDDFKSVNDRYGHAAGDALLVELADRLRRVVRPGDLVARLGGDEFAVALGDVTLAYVDELLLRITDAIGEGLPAECGAQHMAISVGAAHHRHVANDDLSDRDGPSDTGEVDTRPGSSAGDLVSRADASLLVTKRRQRMRLANNAG